MSDYTIVRLHEIPDAFGGKYPGEMRFLGGPLAVEQVTITQEEVYYVISGTLQFKLDDEVMDLDGGTAVRVAPGVVRSVWNDGPDDAELMICSVRIDDVRADAEMIEDFWPE